MGLDNRQPRPPSERQIMHLVIHIKALSKIVWKCQGRLLYTSQRLLVYM